MLTALEGLFLRSLRAKLYHNRISFGQGLKLPISHFFRSKIL